MKKIKFRVWNGREMVYDDIIEFNYIMDMSGDLYSVYRDGDMKDVILSNSPSNLKSTEFTGYKDNNDKEIYSGDIIKIFIGSKGVYYIGVVIKRDDNWVAQLGAEDWEKFYLVDGKGIMEIVGNIYEGVKSE